MIILNACLNTELGGELIKMHFCKEFQITNTICGSFQHLLDSLCVCVYHFCFPFIMMFNFINPQEWQLGHETMLLILLNGLSAIFKHLKISTM